MVSVKELIQENKKSIIVILVLILLLLILSIITNIKSNMKINSIQTVYLSTNENIKDTLLTNYDEYLEFRKEFMDADIISESDFEKYDYIAYFIDNLCEEIVTLKDFTVRSNKLVLNFEYYYECNRECSDDYQLFLIPISNDVYDELPEIDANYENISDSELCESMLVDKPILYLYPESDTYLNIKLERAGDIVTSYPKYNNGWNVYASSNGDLYDDEGNYYYALYWDELSNYKVDFSTGFYVTKDTALDFLEEKLTFIGLSDRERNEFIMYWLPKLESNGKSLVYFELTEEREKENKLYISEEVDSLLRVIIHIKKVDSYTNIKEQELTNFKREGFVVVEWGGREY